MRVIAGTARGLRLETPAGIRIRPTLDRVREALFSILTPQLDGARFLDLFAGTGANGIEALSRGAAAATFVDSHADSITVIKRNLEHTGLAQHATCMRLPLPQGFPRLASEQEPYTIVFADPPRTFGQFDRLLDLLNESPLLTDDGTIIFEHGPDTPVPETAGSWNRFRHAQYGKTSLSFYALHSDG